MTDRGNLPQRDRQVSANPEHPAMSDRQYQVLCAGFLAILLMGLFPPWKVYEVDSGRSVFLRNCGYGFVLSPPASPTNAPPEIHTGRLLVQLMCVAGATGLGVCLAGLTVRPRDGTPPHPSPQ
jgi:hypothetical protein